MRSVTTAEQTLLGSAHYGTYCRVSVEDTTSTWRDLSTLGGLDWNVSGNVTKTTDQIVATATVDLRLRGQNGDSLGPLMTGSAYAGYVRNGGPIKVEMATVALGATPGTSDWKLMFNGVIDSWTISRDHLQVKARDAIGRLLADRWIESNTLYAAMTGTPIETVIQDILNDWADSTSLYVPTSPGFNVVEYNQQQMSVHDALTQLCALIGWVIEPRWDDTTSAFRLTFYEPDRTPSSTSWTWAKDRYKDATTFDCSSLDVRNAGSIWYTDSGTGLRTQYTNSDATSISTYGRQYFEFDEANNSPIDTLAEAQAMLDSALADLKDPIATAQWDTLLAFWPVQLGDYYKFTADGYRFDNDQSFGVTGFTHQWTNNGTVTTLISTRGKPIGFVVPWLNRIRLVMASDTNYVDGRSASQVLSDIDAKGTVFRSASGSTPTANATGDIWVQTDTNQIMVWDGSAWTGAVGSVVSSTAPSSPFLSMVWADTSTTPATIKRYNGSSWDTIGTQNMSMADVPDDPTTGRYAAAEAGADVTGSHSADILLDDVPDGVTDYKLPAALQLQIAGRSPSANLLYNADMRSTDFWSGGVTLPSVGVIRLSVPANGGGSYAYYGSNQTDERGNMRYFPVTPGDVVYISADAQLASGTAQNAYVQAWLYDSAFGNATVLAQFGVTPTGTWATMKGTATVPATIGASAVPAYLKFNVQAAVPAGAGAWACNFRRPALLVNHMTVGVSGGMPANDTSNVNGMASTEVSDGATRARGAIGSDAASLQDGITQTDGAAQRALSKGLVIGSGADTHVVTFASAFQNAPFVVVDAGMSFEPRTAKWSPSFNSALPTYMDHQALDVSASGFTIQARLRQKGTTTPTTDSYSGSAISAVGTSYAIAVSLSGSAADNTYTNKYDISMSASGGKTLTMIVGFDSNDGSGWVQRATKSYATSSSLSVTGDTLVSGVSGLASGDQWRAYIVSITGTGTFSLTPVEVDYTVATGQATASMTPDPDDAVNWSAQVA